MGTSTSSRTPVRTALKEAGDLTVFAGQTLGALRGVPRYTAEVLRQAALLIRGSTLVIGFMCALIGISTINFAFYVLQAAGAADYTGVFAGIAGPRASVPLMFGYIFAAKVGCGITAEIGAMRINEEIDGYEAEAIDPLRFVVATRIAAAILFLPLAAIAGLIGILVAQYFQAVIVLDGLSSSAFIDYYWNVQTVFDQLLAMINMGTTVVVVVVVSAFFGYTASGGPAKVGTAVARALVVNLVLVHFVALGYVSVFYGPNPRLPIGG
jgi:phospholipid/cholesterol/gamma-HCH transport system permease protein